MSFGAPPNMAGGLSFAGTMAGDAADAPSCPVPGSNSLPGGSPIVGGAVMGSPVVGDTSTGSPVRGGAVPPPPPKKPVPPPLPDKREPPPLPDKPVPPINVWPAVPLDDSPGGIIHGSDTNSGNGSNGNGKGGSGGGNGGFGSGFYGAMAFGGSAGGDTTGGYASGMGGGDDTGGPWGGAYFPPPIPGPSAPYGAYMFLVGYTDGGSTDFIYLLPVTCVETGATVIQYECTGPLPFYFYYEGWYTFITKNHFARTCDGDAQAACEPGFGTNFAQEQPPINLDGWSVVDVKITYT